MALGLQGQIYDAFVDKRHQGRIARKGSNLEHKRNLELARAGNTAAPNRTPSASHRAHLARTGGAGGSGGVISPLLSNMPPTSRRKRKRDDEVGI